MRMTAGVFVCAVWVLVAAAPASGAPEKLELDGSHSTVGFRVGLSGVTTVEGRFGGVVGTLMYDQSDLTRSSVTALLDVASLATGSDERDRHLRGPDFFDQQRFPFIAFQSKRVMRRDDGNYDLVGRLTLHGVTREVVLRTQWKQRRTEDPWQNARVGFEAQTTLRRRDFGIRGPQFWGSLISDDVDVRLVITARALNMERVSYFAPQGRAVGAEVGSALEKQGVAAAIQRYRELKRVHPADYQFGVGQLNTLGYKLLGRKKIAEAAEILTLNAAEYPDSWVVHDSLGDAHVAAGKPELAVRDFQRSLALKPDNTSAIESLRSLGHEVAPPVKPAAAEPTARPDPPGHPLDKASALTAVGTSVPRGLTWSAEVRARPASKVLKNVQVLGEVSAERFMAAMQSMKRALGVDCAHCHDPDKFSSDAKPPKALAREMLQMAYDLNANAKPFKGKLTVTCFTCHRGRIKPDSGLPSP